MLLEAGKFMIIYYIAIEDEYRFWCLKVGCYCNKYLKPEYLLGLP